MSELEAGLGIEPVDVIIQRHRRLREKHAELWGKYGPGGVADHLRKSELARLKELLRAKAAQAGTKVTEASLDDAAHDHPDYRDFLAMMLADRATLFETEAKLKEIEWTFQRSQSLIRNASFEPR